MRVFKNLFCSLLYLWWLKQNCAPTRCGANGPELISPTPYIAVLERPLPNQGQLVSPQSNSAQL